MSRKPLSIALEEIEVGKIVKIEVVELEVVEGADEPPPADAG